MRRNTLAMLGAAAVAAAGALVVGVAATPAALGILARYAPTSSSGLSGAQIVNGARDVAVSGTQAYVVDSGNGRVAVFDTRTGGYVRQIGSKGSGQGQLQLPSGIALVRDAAAGLLVAVSDYNGHKIVEYRAADGAFVREFGTRGSQPGQLDQPSSLTADAGGTLYVNDFGNDRIQAFSVGGGAMAKLPDPEGAGGYGNVVDLAVDSGGTLWATYSTAGTVGILQINASDLRLLLKTPLKAGSGPGQVQSTIGGIAVLRNLDTRARTLYVVDPDGYRIIRLGVGPNLGDAPTGLDALPAKGDERFDYKPSRVRLDAAQLHVLGVTPAYAWSVWGAKAAPKGAAAWAGAWTTSWGALSLTAAGTKVTGTYTHDSGRVTGTVSGRTLRGSWSESPTYKGPRDAGTFVVTLSADGTSFSGSWRYADGTLGRDTSWTGKR